MFHPSMCIILNDLAAKCGLSVYFSSVLTNFKNLKKFATGVNLYRLQKNTAVYFSEKIKLKIFIHSIKK